MERERYVEAKKLLAEVHHILEARSLTPQKRDALERHAAQLASALATPWLPTSWTTKFIMGALLALGLQQAWSGDYLATFILWPLLLLFSPHLVAQASYAIDDLSRWLNATSLLRSPSDEHQAEQSQSGRLVAANELPQHSP